MMVSLLEVLHGSIRPVSLQREVPCGHCYGTGAANNRVCPVCVGRTQVPRRDKYQVRIPAGVHDGQRLRIPGRGDNSVGAAQPGDLFLRVRYATHPDFEVQGKNLLCELEIAPWEAVLGGQASVPTLDRKQVSIRIPAGAQTGQKLRVREGGLPGPDGQRGDLLVQLRVKLPEKLTDRERALWVQLAAESSFRPRA
jgi:DnaJ-class molecular chaperone